MKNIKKSVSALMTAFLAFAGAAGLSSCEGDLAQPPVIEPEGGVGTGAWDKPLTVNQVFLGTSNPALDQDWVTGYIVGWVNSGFGTVLNARTATFTVPASYSSNLLLAMNPDETDWEKCITVRLVSGNARNSLNLQDNPGNLHKMVTVRGTTGEKYFGVYGVRDVSMFTWDDEGLEGYDVPPVPTPTPGETIFKALQETDREMPDDWRIDNVRKPSSARDIWSWTQYNSAYYLNARGSGDCLSYFISPEIDLSNYRRASLSFMHAAKFQTTLRSLCGVCVRETGTETWTDVPVLTWPGEGSWTFVNSGALDLTNFAGKKVEIAFRYGSSSAGADTWEIRNVLVSGVRN